MNFLVSYNMCCQCILQSVLNIDLMTWTAHIRGRPNVSVKAKSSHMIIFIIVSAERFRVLIYQRMDIINKAEHGSKKMKIEETVVKHPIPNFVQTSMAESRMVWRLDCSCFYFICVYL